MYSGYIQERTVCHIHTYVVQLSLIIVQTSLHDKREAAEGKMVMHCITGHLNVSQGLRPGLQWRTESRMVSIPGATLVSALVKGHDCMICETARC